MAPPAETAIDTSRMTAAVELPGKSKYDKAAWALSLRPDEQEWADRQPFLLKMGYQLRPRYQPGWSPSWVGVQVSSFYCEDSITLGHSLVIDARRIVDGMLVAIKCLENVITAQNETEITRFLSSGERRTDPQNHCIPLLDVLRDPHDPNKVFLVEPWVTPFDQPPLETTGAFVDFVHQTIEGIAFMHRHGVAHRDCTAANIGMDSRPLFGGADAHPMRVASTMDGKEHLKPLPRAVAPVKYFFYDFGISTWLADHTQSCLVTGEYGRDQDVPELSDSVPYDPFKVDVFILGNLYRKHYLDIYRGLEIFRPLVASMTDSDPWRRPTASEALQTFRGLALGLSSTRQRWPLRKKAHPYVVLLVLDTIAVIRELIYRLRTLLRCLVS